MLYVLELPEQTVALPVMDPGVVGTPVIVTANACAADVPHALVAVTEILPPVALAVVVIDVVVDVPVQPPGNVHV